MRFQYFKSILILGLLIIIAILIYSVIFSWKQCGGFTGAPCSFGYECRLEGNYPDAAGTCAFSPLSVLIELRNKFSR